jgi:hypothetical protein
MFSSLRLFTAGGASETKCPSVVVLGNVARLFELDRESLEGVGFSHWAQVTVRKYFENSAGNP